MKASAKLESAETKLLGTAAKLRLKETKSGKKAAKKGSPEHDVEAGTSIAGAEVVVPPESRPSHKLGFLGLFGEKVDTIVWARNEIAECTRLLDEGRSKISGFDERGTANPGDEEDDELADAALDAEGNPRLAPDDRFAPNHVGKHAKGAVVGAAKGAKTGVAEGVNAIKGRLGAGSTESPYPTMNSAFVTFNRQIAAHLAVQVLTHHEPYRMSELL